MDARYRGSIRLMLLSPRFLSWLGFSAWGLALLTITLPGAASHAAVAELWPCIPYSENALEGMQVLVRATVAGFVVGIGIGGILCDRWGRFRVLLGSMFLAPATSALSALAFYPGDFFLFRFLSAVASGSVVLSSAILIFEASSGQDRPRRYAMGIFGAVSGFVLATVLWHGVQSISFILPYVPWRNFLLLHAIPFPFVFLLTKHHDEPRDWKTGVRDVGHEIPFSVKFRRTFFSHHFRSYFAVILAGVFAFGGMDGMFREMNRQVRNRIRSEDAERLKTSADLHRACAVLRYLVAYPALLDMKNLDPFDLSVLPVLLRSPWLPEKEPQGSLAEAIRELHAERSPIDMASVMERGIVCRNRHEGRERPAGAVPLREIEAFNRESSACFERGADILDAENILYEEQDFPTRTELWSARRENLLKLDRDVRNFLKKRLTQVDMARSFFVFLFLFGVLSGTTVLFRAKNRTNGMPIIAFVFLLSFSSACLLFDRYWHEIPVVVSAIGAFGLGWIPPLVFVPCFISLPILFQPAVRASACGIGFAVGAGIAGLLFFIVPESYHGALIAILLCSFCIFTERFSTGAEHESQNMKSQ